MTTQVRPVSYGASYLAFECCCCTMIASDGITVVEKPLYAQVMVCQKCGDLCCALHFKDGLCYSCGWLNE